MIRKHLKRPTSGIYGTCLAMNRLEFEFSLTKFSLANCCVCYRPQRSCGKVMFSQASVILSTGEGVCGRHPPAKCMLGYTPPAKCMLGYTQPCPVHAGIHAPPAATAAKSTHPTGMHSCFWCDHICNHICR